MSRLPILLFALFLLAPQRAGAERFVFPALSRTQLPNGLKVVVARMPASTTIEVRLVILAGSATDPPTRPGVARMLTEVLGGGALYSAYHNRVQHLRQVGGELIYATEPDYSYIGVRAPRSEIEPALALLSAIAQHPPYSTPVLLRARDKLGAELTSRTATAGFIAHRVLERALFGQGSPYASATPTVASLSAIALADLEGFHRAHWHPNAAVLLIVGDVDPELTQTLVQGRFAAWPREPLTPMRSVPAPEPLRRTIYLVPREGDIPVYFECGTLTLKRSDPDFLPVLVAAEVFGGHPLGRIAFDVREQPGVVKVRLGAEQIGTTFAVFGTLRSDLLDDYLKEFFVAAQDLGSHPIPDDDLQPIKEYLQNLLYLSAEDPASIARMVVEQEVYGLAADYWSTYADRLDKIDTLAVRDAAARYFHPDRMQLVVVGSSQITAALAPFGKVVRVDAAGRISPTARP